MNRASAEWLGPLLLVFALRAVVPGSLGSDAASTAASGETAPASPDSGTDTNGAAASEQTSSDQKLDPLLDANGKPKPAIDPCVEALERLQAQSQTSIPYPLPLDQTLLITLPDPLDTPAAAVFDSSLETIVEAFAEADYVRDRFVLPPERAKSDANEAPSTRRCPAIMLFRNTKPDHAREVFGKSAPPGKDIAVLVVGESSAWGHDREALSAALGMIAAPCCLPDATEREELRIAGPYYSGATPGLLTALATFSKEHCVTYRMATGTVSADTSAKRLEELNKDKSIFDPPFQSFTRTLSDRKRKITDFIALKEGDGLAILQESGTLYGQRSSPKEGGEVWQTYEIAYPPNISALRDAYSVLARTAHASRGSAAGRLALDRLPLSLERPVVARDTLRPFAPATAMVVHDLALQRVVTTLHEQRVGDAIVSGVLPEDIVFLSQRLKSGVPDLRVSTYQMDSLFLHSECARDLRGSLAVSSYPLVDRFQDKERGPRVLRPILSRDSASGLFHAVRWLLDPNKRELPNLSLGVLSHGRFWPLSMQEPFKQVSVPGEFTLITSVFLALALLNAFVMFRLRFGQSAQTPSGSHDRVWLLSGLAPCEEPVLACWHRAVVCVSQCALVAPLFVLAGTWLIIAELESQSRWKPLLMLLVVVVMLVVCLRTLQTTLANVVTKSADTSKSVSESVMSRVKFWSNATVAAIGGSVLLVGVLATYGLFQTIEGERPMLLLRTLEFSSGASPLCVVFLACAFVYHFGLAHASRLRMIDFDDSKSKETPEAPKPLSRRFVLCRATHSRDQVQEREDDLFKAAILPGGTRNLIGALVAVIAPILVAVHVRRNVFMERQGFTLENWGLTLSMELALLLCFGIAVVTTLQALRLWRSLAELLHGLASSDLLEAFKHVERPINRSVAEQLALGREDKAERAPVLAALARSSSVPPPMPPIDRQSGPPTREELMQAAEQTRHEVDTLASPSKREVYDAAKIAHDIASAAYQAVKAEPGASKLELETTKTKLDAATAELEAAKAEREAATLAIDSAKAALASYVAIGLPRWIKQFRFLLWLVTVGTAVLLISSTSYVFTIRRLLATIFSFFTLAVVAAGASIFVGLERDEILSRIGGTPAGKIALQSNLLRIASWGVLPVALAFATYYPEAIRGLLSWFDTIGGAP